MAYRPSVNPTSKTSQAVSRLFHALEPEPVKSSSRFDSLPPLREMPTRHMAHRYPLCWHPVPLGKRPKGRSQAASRRAVPTAVSRNSGEIISERRATSNRIGGRYHPGFAVTSLGISTSVAPLHAPAPRRGGPVLLCPHTGTRLFPMNLATEFMMEVGASWVDDHNTISSRRGQRVPGIVRRAARIDR
jgi:hypothetical protein